jgi:hypothetical protein
MGLYSRPKSYLLAFFVETILSTPTRTQTRTTTTGGDPVPDNLWTITSDTGPLPVTTGGKLNVVAVTASGNDGNLPSNVIDGNFSTRWSSFGKGQNITLDLGASAQITEVDIAWYKGDTGRKSNFVIDVSQDGTNFTNFFSGLSSGTTTQFEKYTAGFLTGRYVRVTVNGNNQNDWASITEIQVIGSGGGGTPTCPPGQHWDSTTNQCVPDTTGGGALDEFGIAKVYADATGPRNNWALHSASDSRLMEQKPVPVSGQPGWYTYPNLTQGRIEVMSQAGLTEKNIATFDVTKVIDKGYYVLPFDDASGKGDFGDVEITVAYANVKLGSGSYEAHPEIVYQGFRQTNDTTKAGADQAVEAQCEAASYHDNLYSHSTRHKYEKDSKHTSGYTVNSSDPQTTAGCQAYEGGPTKQVIHKMIVYRVPNPNIRGGRAVKIETYVDYTGAGTAQSLKKLHETLDDGHWGPTNGGNSACNCPAPFSGTTGEFVVLNMDRATVGIRIDFMQSFWFGKWSVRSIDRTQKLIT